MTLDRKARHHESGGQRGTALVLALFLITVLTVLGTMVLNTSIVEIKMAQNQKISSQVFYAAEAGLERAILMLIADFESDTTGVNDPWGNSTFYGWAETVTPAGGSGSVTFDPDVRSLDMYTSSSDPGLRRLTLGAGHDVNGLTFDLYLYNVSDSEVYVLSHAYGNGGTAALEYHLRVENVAPYNNAIFTGSGIAGQFQGSVNVAGSMYSKGNLTLGAGVEVHNFYGGANHPGNAMPSGLENLLAPVVDLEAKIRVKDGMLDVSTSSVRVGDSYLDTTTGENGYLEGIYADEGVSWPTSTYQPYITDDNIQQNVPDVPMPTILDGLEDEFGDTFIQNCITTQGYSGNSAAVATSLYADWVSGQGCWSADPSLGVVFDAGTIPGSPNLIDSSTASFSYDDGLGNGLFWDNATMTLQIKGNVVIEGNLNIGQANGNDDIVYEVMGDSSTGFDAAVPATLYCSGNLGIRGNFSPDTSVSGYLNPGQGINSLGVVTPGDITFDGKPGNFYTGFYYAQGQVNFNKQAALGGTVIAGLVNFANVPDVYQVPNLRSYLPKAVPGGSDVFKLQNREWRRVY